MGFCLSSLALMILAIMIAIYRVNIYNMQAIKFDDNVEHNTENIKLNGRSYQQEPIL